MAEGMQALRQELRRMMREQNDGLHERLDGLEERLPQRDLGVVGPVRGPRVGEGP